MGNPISSHSGLDLYDNLLESALSQHVNKPTRDDNILDLIFSTNETLIGNVIVGPEFSTSDHKIVRFNIDLKVYEENLSDELVYVYSKGNYDKLRTIVSEIDWSQLSRETDINSSWNKFTDILNSAVKACIPVCKRRPYNNTKPKWWNNQIKASLSDKKNRAYRKYQQTHEVDIAETLNEYFASVFTSEDTNDFVETPSAPVNTMFLYDCEFTEKNVLKVLDNIKVNKTPGPDGNSTTGIERNQKSNM